MTKTATTRYRFVGQHVDDLHDGRTLEPGAFVNLTAAELEQPHNLRLIEEGHLVDAAEKKEGN
jgi:hypothetical protein